MGNLLSTEEVCDALHDITEIENILKGRLISKITTNEITLRFNEKVISHYITILHIIDKNINDHYKIGLLPDYITPLKVLKDELTQIWFKTEVSIKYIKHYNKPQLKEIECNLKLNNLTEFIETSILENYKKNSYHNLILSPFIRNDEMKQFIVESKIFPDSINQIIFEYTMDIRENILLHSPYFQWFYAGNGCVKRKTTSLLNMKFIDFREINSSQTAETNKMEIRLFRKGDFIVMMEIEMNHDGMKLNHESIEKQILHSNYDRNIHCIQIPQTLNFIVSIENSLNANNIHKDKTCAPYKIYNFQFPELFITVDQMLNDTNLNDNIYKIVEIYPRDKDLLINNELAIIDTKHVLHPNLDKLHNINIGGFVIYRWDKDGQTDSARVGIYTIDNLMFDTLYLWKNELISNHCDYTLWRSFGYWQA